MTSPARAPVPFVSGAAAASAAGSSARLAELLNMAAGWPQLFELRAAAGSRESSCHNRCRHAITSLAVCARAEMAAALLAQRARRPGQGAPVGDEVSLAVLVLCGAARHGPARRRPAAPRTGLAP